MLKSSWEIFNSVISILVPLADLTLWRTSGICRLAWRQVLISASTTFYSVSNRPIPLVLVVSFGIRTRIVHPNYWGISPVCHMCYTRSTRNIHRSLRRGPLNITPGMPPVTTY